LAIWPTPAATARSFDFCFEQHYGIPSSNPVATAPSPALTQNWIAKAVQFFDNKLSGYFNCLEKNSAA
jgi:hypothetical protein